MIYSSNFCFENFSLSKNRTFSQMKYLNLIFPSLFIHRLFESLWSNQHSILICKLYLNTIFIWLIQPSFFMDVQSWQSFDNEMHRLLEYSFILLIHSSPAIEFRIVTETWYWSEENIRMLSTKRLFKSHSIWGILI